MTSIEDDLIFKSQEHIVFVNQLNNGAPGNIIQVNETACNKLGYTREEFLSIPPEEIGLPLITAYLSNIMIKLFSGEQVSYDMIFFTKTKQTVLTNIQARKCDFNGEKAVLTIAKEITDHNYIKNIIIKNSEELVFKMLQIKKTQDQLIQQEKLASIGQLAAGVAHEINNPLGYISSNIETAHKYVMYFKKIMNSYENLISKFSKITKEELNIEIKKIDDKKLKYNLDFVDNDIEELFNDVEDGLKKISEIVNTLKTFARVNNSIEYKEYNLNKGIKDALTVARNEVKYIAKVDESLGNIPIILAAENRINEVLLNIILNSCYAIKDKKTNEQGVIKISTSIEDKFVICKIEDNGIGIKKEDLNNIFNPFFTTKPIVKGTGLGLSIAYDIIVNKHNGEIFAESTLGVGTCFTIKLPINQTKIENENLL